MLILQAVVTVSTKASCNIIFLTSSCLIFWPCLLLEQVVMDCDWFCIYDYLHSFWNVRENATLIIDFKQKKAMLSFNSKDLCSLSKFYFKNLTACVYPSAHSQKYFVRFQQRPSHSSLCCCPEKSSSYGILCC